MDKRVTQSNRPLMCSSSRRVALILLLLLSTYAVALAQSGTSTGFTLTMKVTEFDDKGNSFPSWTEKLYFSSSGDWRRAVTYANGQVVETIYLRERGVYFHDHEGDLLLRFGDVGPGRLGPTTAEALMAKPTFVRTEYVFDRVAYLQRRDIGPMKEETYFTPATGPFPFKRITYYDRFKRVEEPVELTFAEPDKKDILRENYTVVEEKPLIVRELTNQIQEQPVPQYPAQARAAGISGNAVIQVIVDETGQVISARINSAPPMLGEAAMEAAHRARFSPLEKDGRPVKFRGLLYYKFQPKSETTDNASPGTPD
ncbi:MAG TPA: energy transducer TonB [Pyrinomonadaceae bacterium]|nr:energy transducer TonB [Pyrinomonadaceae bacterium]